MSGEKIVIVAATRTSIFDTLDKVVGPYYDLDHLAMPTSVERVVQRVETRAAGAVIIECDRKDFDWATAVHELARLPKRPHVLVVGGNSHGEALLSAFRDGADGYLTPSALAEDLLPALAAVAEGRVFYRQKDAALIRGHLQYLELGSARHVADVQNGIAQLTVREKEVFPLLADGKSIRETARTLGISPKTVETHKYNIMKKLHLDTMADFTKLGMIKDLIPI